MDPRTRAKDHRTNPTRHRVYRVLCRRGFQESRRQLPVRLAESFSSSQASKVSGTPDFLIPKLRSLGPRRRPRCGGRVGACRRVSPWQGRARCAVGMRSCASGVARLEIVRAFTRIPRPCLCACSRSMDIRRRTRGSASLPAPFGRQRSGIFRRSRRVPLPQPASVTNL
jgi:hypothetical protein